MKFMQTTLACTLLAFTAPLGAQITGGSGAVTEPVDAEAEQARPAQDYAALFPDRTFTRVGTASPTGSYGDLPSQTGYVYYNSSAIEPVFAGGAGATGGWFLEFDRSVFPDVDFLPIQLPVGVIGIGYGIAASASYVGMGWSEIFDYDDVEIALGEILSSFRVGPKVSYMPLPQLYVSTSFKLGAGLGLGSYSEVYDYPLLSGRQVDIIESMAPAIGLARSFGFDVQFAGLALGWELNSIGLTRTRNHELFFSDGETVDFEYEVAVPASTSRFFVGFSF